MRTTLSRVLVALLALAALCGALSACNDYAYRPVDQSGYQSMNTVLACMDETGQHVPDEYCGNDMFHPRPHYYTGYGRIFDDGDYVPGYGRPLVGFSRQRPANYNVNITIIHTSPSGGTVTRTGTGTAMTSRSTLGSGRTIPKAPASYPATVKGQTDNAAASTPSKSPSSTVQRGGLGVPKSSSTSSSSSSGSKSSSSSSSSKSGK